ncbi:MAG: TIGR00725 family protein [Aquificota bacterium]|nr:MAG: TIGR00725 family protein [Aquificota bacterium]
MAKAVVGVIGASQCNPQEYERAYQLGRGIARLGAFLVCGGLGGVMEAASKGAREEGGLVIGIIPQSNPGEANPYVTVAVATGMGHARNSIIVNTAQVLVAVGGEYGTLSEIALALKGGKAVLGLDTWDIPGVIRVSSVKETLRTLEGLLR